ncbi:MAG: Nif11 family protein [Spirulinaceae cyanobacterium RM2_2_10]|nr:Nif11 family protein [Spirulinaceae cyanobacterium SM2_1_0]NJO19442.1 Nif11 family protein [Spirulinaceae cyanobacterium RM2_2_10]
MSQREAVIDFFQKVCGDEALQYRLKTCPPTRQGFAAVAQDSGYGFSGEDIDEYVQFVGFYEQCQTAIAKHQNGDAPLADWLNKWQKHVQRFTDNPLDDYEDTLRRFI